MNYWINVTQDCNLHCQYCYQKEHHQPVYMQQVVADKIIEFIIREGAGEAALNFFGGEALLNFEIIQYLVTRLYPLGVQNFALTTNLVPLTVEMIKFLLKYPFRILISLDGDRKTHDLNRITKNQKGTFDIVFKNLKKLMLYPQLNLSISKVLTMNNLITFYEDYCFLKGLGIPVYVNVELDGGYIDNEQLLEVYQEQIDAVFADYLQSENYDQFPYFKKYYQRFLNLRKSTTFDIDLSQYSCTTPDNAQLVFDSWGQARPCHMMVEVGLAETALPLKPGMDPKELRRELFTLTPMFLPFAEEEIFHNLYEEICLKNCNDCKYILGCLEYMLLHAKSSCIFKRYRRRVSTITRDKRLLCYTKLILNSLEKFARSPLENLQLFRDLRGDDDSNMFI